MTVLTYQKWLELGFRVKPGEKSRGYHIHLFHRDQTEISADKLPKVSPIAEARAPKPSRKNTKVLITEPKRTGC